MKLLVKMTFQNINPILNISNEWLMLKSIYENRKNLLIYILSIFACLALTLAFSVVISMPKNNPWKQYHEKIREKRRKRQFEFCSLERFVFVFLHKWNHHFEFEVDGDEQEGVDESRNWQRVLERHFCAMCQVLNSIKLLSNPYELPLPKPQRKDSPPKVYITPLRSSPRLKLTLTGGLPSHSPPRSTFCIKLTSIGGLSSNYPPLGSLRRQGLTWGGGSDSQRTT